MLLKTVLRDFCLEFDVFLLEFLEIKIKLAEKINPNAAQNLEEIKKLIIGGGKRIRPFLVFLGFGLFAKINEKNKVEIFKIGASLELFHTFALIHDDIIDNSLIRRGKPTVEQNYLDFFDNLEKELEIEKEKQLEIQTKAETERENCQNYCLQKQNLNSKMDSNLANNIDFENNVANNNVDNTEDNLISKKYSFQTKKLASSAAILAGDYAHTLADSLVNSVQNEKVREIYYQMQFELVAGQIDDCFGISLENLDKISKENVLNMLIHKSGNYSIQKPLLMGMNLAIGNFKNNEAKNKLENKIDKNLELGKMLKIMAEFGQDLGLVFQLVDDILGVFGENSVTGKSVTSDMEGGKKTLLIIQTWANCDKCEKQIILANLGNPNGNFEALRELIRQKGLDYVQQMVNELSQKIIKNVKKLQKMEQTWKENFNLENQIESNFESNFETKIKTEKNQNQDENNKNSNQNWQILLELIDYLANRKS